MRLRKINGRRKWEKGNDGRKEGINKMTKRERWEGRETKENYGEEERADEGKQGDGSTAVLSIGQAGRLPGAHSLRGPF